MSKSTDVIRQVLDTFYQCKNNRMFCQLFMETINGQQFCNISLQIPEGFPTRKSNFYSGKKSPSTMRRNRARLEKWKLTKRTTPSTCTPTKLVQHHEDSLKESSPILKEVSLKDVGMENCTSQEDILENCDSVCNSVIPPAPSETKTSTLMPKSPSIKPSNKDNEPQASELLIDKLISNHIVKEPPPEVSDPLKALADQFAVLNRKLLGILPSEDNTLHDEISRSAPNIVSDDNPEDHNFEEAALWARKQKKDFKM